MNKLAASKWSKKNQKQEKMELNYPLSQTVLQNNIILLHEPVTAVHTIPYNTAKQLCYFDFYNNT